MRGACLLSIALACSGFGAPLGAQPPKPDPKVAAARLDEILEAWERNHATFRSLHAQFDAKKVYKNLAGQTKLFDGEAKFLKQADGGFGADVLQTEKRADGAPKADSYERVVFTGQALYFFDPAAKELLVQPVPPPAKGQAPAEGPMPFSIFLMKKEDVKRRFDLEVSGIDGNYTYLEVRPRFNADRQDFTYARLVVMNRDVRQEAAGAARLHLPRNLLRELFWQEPNKAEVTWTLRVMELNGAAVRPADVAKPTPPPGWRVTNLNGAR